MQIVIDIPDEKYDRLVYQDIISLRSYVENGTVIPKGHGRILDEKDILDTENNNGGWYDLVDMPDYIARVKPIIVADRAESEDTEDKKRGAKNDI